MSGLITLGLGPNGTAAFLSFGLRGSSQSGSAQPNPRRTILVEASDNVGAFPPYSTAEADTMGFDLSWKLAPGEAIKSIVSLDLSPIGPAGVTDPSPGLRALSIPSITGNICSQRFGNWQDIATIQYEVELIVQTSLGNAPAYYGTVTVNRPVN